MNNYYLVLSKNRAFYMHFKRVSKLERAWIVQHYSIFHF